MKTRSTGSLICTNYSSWLNQIRKFQIHATQGPATNLEEILRHDYDVYVYTLVIPAKWWYAGTSKQSLLGCYIATRLHSIIRVSIGSSRARWLNKKNLILVRFNRGYLLSDIWWAVMTLLVDIYAVSPGALSPSSLILYSSLTQESYWCQP